MHDRATPHHVANLVAPVLAVALATGVLAGGSTPGDDCAIALPAVVGMNGPVNMFSMLGSSDIPANGSCAYLNWTSATRDAWWNFTAPIDGGSLSLDFCASNYDTSVVIYEGDCGALTRVACDDDSCAPAGPVYQSKISDLPVSGGDVYIRVGGYGGAAGNAAFVMGFVPFGSVRAWGDASAVSSLPADLGPVIAVAAGSSHALAIRSDGTVRAWGFNCCGQTNVPADLGPVKAIAAEGWQSMALRRDGVVRAWGFNSYGQSNVPSDLGPVTAISSGGEFSSALTAAGAVRVWGTSYDGVQAIPAGMGAVRAISAGSYHMLAIRSDGTVAAWGGNGYGQTNVPVGLGPVTAVAAGTGHSLALMPDGSVRGWGSNNYGQITPPALLGPVTKIAANGAVNASVDARGRVCRWGKFVHEAWGGGTVVTPTPNDLGPAVDVSISEAFCIAVTLTNPCSGDLDLSGGVDGADLGVLLSSWGPAPAGASTDVNHDGVVDGADLGAMLANWGGCR
jgi:hypothetical protein